MEKEKAFILRDFKTFARHSGMVPDYQEQPHDEMCDNLESQVPEFGSKSQKKKVYLAPRGSYKTSLIKAFMVYCIYKWPDIRIVYGRANDQDAAGVLRSVKNAMQNNPTLVRLFGNPEDSALIWAEEQIVLSRPNANLTDATIATTGLGRTLTGAHPDLVILDDLVTDVNYRSEKAIERSRTLLQSVYPVLEPHGSVILCGTRWAHNDVYGWVLGEDAELYEKTGVREWDQYIRAVVNDGEWFFPSVLSEEFIEKQRRSLRTQMMLFSSWYYNSPEEIGTKLFPKHHMSFIDAKFYRSPGPHLELPDGTYIPLRVTMTVDPAPTVGKYSDFTGVTVVGTDYQENWYILWAEDFKRVPSDAGRYLCDIVRVFAPEYLAIETGMADPAMVARIQQGLKDLDCRTAIVSYMATQYEAKGQRSKGARIEALEPLFREGKIKFVRGSATFRELLRQLDGYGSLDHDDVLDALAMQRAYVRRCKDKTIYDQEQSNEELEERLSWGPDGPPAVAKRGKISGVRVGLSAQLGVHL